MNGRSRVMRLLGRTAFVNGVLVVALLTAGAVRSAGSEMPLGEEPARGAPFFVSGASGGYDLSLDTIASDGLTAAEPGLLRDIFDLPVLSHGSIGSDLDLLVRAGAGVDLPSMYRFGIAERAATHRVSMTGPSGESDSLPVLVSDTTPAAAAPAPSTPAPSTIVGFTLAGIGFGVAGMILMRRQRQC